MTLIEGEPIRILTADVRHQLIAGISRHVQKYGIPLLPECSVFATQFVDAVTDRIFLDTGKKPEGRYLLRYMEHELESIGIDYGTCPNGMSYNEAVRLFACAAWTKGGCRRYVLSDSVASMLVLTRAAPIDWNIVPVDSFMIDVPWKFFPIATGTGGRPGAMRSRTFILVHRSDDLQIIYGEADPAGVRPQAAACVGQHDFAEDDMPDVPTRLMARFASNAVNYISAHRECVSRPAFSINKKASSVLNVRIPRDVVVDSVMRNRAITLASATSLRDLRGALRHVVRGHWKRQTCGPSGAERKMIWVRPYERGDESLGRVVEKIERITNIGADR